MIVDLPGTTTSKVSKKLQELRESGGVVTLGRVLSLVVETDLDHLEAAVEAANGASKLHPCRIIVLAKADRSGESRLDAEIRVGGDAGASEVVVLRAFGEVLSNQESLVTGLLLPDAPVVAWWPSECSGNPGQSAIGKIASRRITDAAMQPRSAEFLAELAKSYSPGDSDMAWARITLWRSQLTSLFEARNISGLKSIVVFANPDSPSAMLLARWLQLSLGVPSEIVSEIDGSGITGISGIRLEAEDGDLELMRTGQIATISQPGFPSASVLLPQRSDLDCLVEDMRFLGEDLVYARVLDSFK